ncbi:M20/M25/M40 family metallo-hydrolase [Thalassotalea piscium]
MICYLLCSCSSTQINEQVPVVETNFDDQYLLNDLKVLSSEQFMGRKTGTEGSLLSQQFLISQLKILDVPAFQGKYDHTFEISRKGVKGHNIIAYIPGSENTNKVIVLSAHYDHLGQSSYQGTFNGADDNASGTVALLSFAKNLVKQPLKHNVIMLFTDAEELNLVGAKAFLKDLGGLRENILLNINLDMLAGSYQQSRLFTMDRLLTKVMDPEYINGLKRLQHAFTPSILSNFNRTKGKNINKRISWIKASDHGAFYKYQIPFIYFGVGTHRNYHTVKDNYENANKTLFVKNVQNIYKQLVYIDKFLNR